MITTTLVLTEAPDRPDSAASTSTSDRADPLATGSRDGGGDAQEHPLVAGVVALLGGVDPRDLRRVPAGGTWYAVGGAVTHA